MSNYSDLRGISGKKFKLGKNSQIELHADKVTLNNNEATPVAVPGFTINPALNKAFKAEISLKRVVPTVGFDHVQNNGDAGVKGVLTSLATSNLPSPVVALVFGEFSGGLYALKDNGTLESAFMANLGTGFNGAVNAVIDSGGRFYCFGAFTSFNGNTRNRVAVLNYDGSDDASGYADFGSPTSSGTGFNGTVTCALNGDYTGLAIGGMTVGGSFSTLNGTSCEDVVGVAPLTSPVSYNTTAMVGTPSFLFQNPSTSYLLIAGISTLSNPDRRIVSFSGFGTGVEFTAATPFDDTILGMNSDATGANIYVVGKFSSYDGNTAALIAKIDSTTGAFTSGYNPFTFTSGNYISCIWWDNVTGNIYLSGKFNDYTSQNFVGLDDSGAELTSFMSQFGTGFTNPIYAFGLNSYSNSITGSAFFGEARHTPTDAFTIGYINGSETNRQLTLVGVYDTSVGYIVLPGGQSTPFGDDCGVTFSMGTINDLNYQSTNVASSTIEMKYLIHLL